MFTQIIMASLAIATAEPRKTEVFFNREYNERIHNIALLEGAKSRLESNIEYLLNHRSRRYDYVALAQQYKHLQEIDAALTDLKRLHNNYIKYIL
tara:strand:+ start:489 stop:773 length:285 start_codon:yes stop_codon:yes gene_type:complete